MKLHAAGACDLLQHLSSSLHWLGEKRHRSHTSEYIKECSENWKMYTWERIYLYPKFTTPILAFPNTEFNIKLVSNLKNLLGREGKPGG